MSDFVNTVDIIDDDILMDGLIERSISGSFNDDKVTKIKVHAFSYCTNLESVSFPSATSIGGSAFYSSGLKAITEDTFPLVTSIGLHTGNIFQNSALETVNWPSFTSLYSSDLFRDCKFLRSVNFSSFANTSSNNSSMFRNCTSLINVNLPLVQECGNSLFYGCTSLKTITLPCATKVYYGTFSGCTSLQVIDLPSCTSIGGSFVFSDCSALKALILRSTAMCAQSNPTNLFDNSGIAKGTGYIYVPAALVDSYKADTNWSNYASQFRPLENYTVDGTTIGAIREYCESIALDVTELTFTDANSQTLNATGCGIFDSITWTSSDTTVARVENGVVTPIGDGTATITVTCGEHSLTCEVTVNAGLDSTLYNWDFTTSLVDTINGTEATFPSGYEATQDSNGLTFSAASQACVLGDVVSKGCRIEIDIASMNISDTSVNHRFVMLGSRSSTFGPLIWHKANSAWGCYKYNSAWATDYTLTDLNGMSGTTIALEIDSSGYCTLYVDGVSYGSTGADVIGDNTLLVLGNTDAASSGGDISTTVITGLRIFTI